MASQGPFAHLMPRGWKSQKMHIPLYFCKLFEWPHRLKASKGPQTLSFLQPLPCLRIVIFNELSLR